MSTVVIDGRTGASGDMLLGALLDAGADGAVLSDIAAQLDVSYDIDAVTDHGIAATAVTVSFGPERDESGPIEGHGPHRTISDVHAILDDLEIDGRVRSRARSAFTLLAEAEAAVHGTELDSVHFHEVGADDAIADIVGVAALLETLDPKRVLVTPMATGHGEVESSHGVYPIPPPAVVEIAERSDLVLTTGPIESELLTPTGAAILGAMGEPVDTVPPMAIDSIGYGAGSRRFDARPNVLRIRTGSTRSPLARERISVLETTVDDTTPEVLGHLQDRLVDVGALDVSITPVTMKKSRPGHRIVVIVDPTDADHVARALAEETGTLGIRERASTHRWVADRDTHTVSITVDGTVYDIDVKVATDAGGDPFDRSAEFEQAAEIATQTDQPVREILALAAARSRELDQDR